MRRLLPLVLVLVVALPATAADLCITDGGYFCCHFLCDVPTPVGSAGYSTTPGDACDEFAPLFTISRSDTDPHLNEGPLADPTLYLWVGATSGYGFANGWMEFSGDMQVTDVTVVQDGVSVAWAPELQHLEVYGCLYESTVVATLTVDTPVDIDHETWGRIKALWK